MFHTHSVDFSVLFREFCMEACREEDSAITKGMNMALFGALFICHRRKQ